MKGLHKTAFILIIVGAINWGLIGLFGLNLVTLVFGKWPILVSIVYILIGFAGVYKLFAKRDWKKK